MAHVTTGTITRNLEPALGELLAEEPVLVINGARTVGKSTLLRACARRHAVEVVDLDDSATRDLVRADPRFFASAPGPVMIDEFQHVPEVLDAIKAELNRDLRAGRFVLTGSARYLTLPRASQSLAGRAHIVTMWPFSQGELAGARETFVDRVLHDPASLVTHDLSDLTREDYHQRVLAGGFPLAVTRPAGRARSRWFRDYVTTVVERDVLDIRKVRQRAMLPKILARLAAQTAQVLNVAEVARSVGLEKNLVGDFTQLLETVFLIHRLPAFGRTLNSRVAVTPKVHMVDSGLAAHLLDVSAARLASRDPSALTEFGHLTETFAVNEVIKQAGSSETFVDVSHFRARDRAEVDLVLEAEDGHIAGVEVKAAGRVHGADLRGLRALRDKAGDRFVAGIVVYLGSRAYTYDDRIHVLPLDSLWVSGGR